jgi:excisionase family DNA binding protein
MEFLTVEETAHRLGVSLATVRRWAGEGKLPAEKSGKQWVIDGSRLRQGRIRREADFGRDLNLDKAMRHVQSTDLSEAPVPDILRWEDEAADQMTVLDGARNRLEGGQLGDAIEVRVDKDALSTRPMIMLGLEDRVAYQALVASFSEKIESKTPDAVFSARLARSDRYFFLRAPDRWGAWRQQALDALKAGGEWLAITDLTAYFETIPHRQLLADLQLMNVDADTTGVLREMLDRWSVSEGRGLPQGPNASRLLGNLFLLPIDQAMLDSGWRYSRFLDDILIVTNTRAEAVEAVRQFQDECRVRGLIMSSAKTNLLHGEAAQKHLTRSTKLAGVEYLMNVRPRKRARKELKALLRGALKREAAINAREAKFSLWRLAKLREDSVLPEVLERVEELAPVATVTAAYLQPFVERPEVVSALRSFLADNESSYSPYLATWLLATMAEHPEMPDPWSEQAMRRLKNRNERIYLRAVAAVVVGRGRRPADIGWIKREIANEHDPRMLRAYAVALWWADQLSKPIRRELVARAPTLRRTLAYLEGRDRLPSMIYRDKSLVLRTG